MPLKPLARRTFLRASGVAVGLPFLDAMAPAATPDAKTPSPKRTLLVGRPLGLYTPYFFPEGSGKDYKPSRYLKLLDSQRGKYTVFSGMSHRYGAGHYAEVGLMTGVHPDRVRPSEIRNSVSLDQEIAAHIGGKTRFASLVVGGGAISWNHRGVRVPAQHSATDVFRQLFVQGSREEQTREIHRIQDGQSILDDLRGQVAGLNSKLGPADRRRLEEYLASVRDAEKRLQQDEHWAGSPKPKVDVPVPTKDFGGAFLVERSKQWYDLARLAFQTDSTRVISLYLGSQQRPEIEGVTIAHHDASHHGQEPAKLEQLAKIEEAELKALGEFLDSMAKATEGTHTLLDRTAVFYASNLGNSSSHDNTNLPILLAGGSFKHTGHIAYNRKENTYLSNLFVRILHHMDVEAKKFGASTGVVSEI